MASLGKNVAKAICYCNTSPLMLGLGGAQLRGQSVETVPISEQHLAVQFDESLHKRTIAEIEKLAKSEAGKSEAGKSEAGKRSAATNVEADAPASARALCRGLRLHAAAGSAISRRGTRRGMWSQSAEISADMNANAARA